MSSKLPDFIEPFRYAEQARRLSGHLLLSNMPRLVEQAGDQDGAVDIELAFDIDRQKRYFLTGKITGFIQLTCERCLSRMKWPLNAEVQLLIVTSEEEAERLGPNEEFLLVDEERLSLRDIIEDEIILALPIIASHEEGVCETDPQYSLGELSEEETRSETVNPFSVLTKLKN